MIIFSKNIIITVLFVSRPLPTSETKRHRKKTTKIMGHLHATLVVYLLHTDYCLCLIGSRINLDVFALEFICFSVVNKNHARISIALSRYLGQIMNMVYRKKSKENGKSLNKPLNV